MAIRDACAQQKPVPVIGVLVLTSPSIGTVPANLAALREGLRETDYIEGQNLRIEYRWAERDPERLPGLAADLIMQKVDVVVTELPERIAHHTRGVTCNEQNVACVACGRTRMRSDRVSASPSCAVPLAIGR